MYRKQSQVIDMPMCMRKVTSTILVNKGMLCTAIRYNSSATQTRVVRCFTKNMASVCPIYDKVLKIAVIDNIDF